MVVNNDVIGVHHTLASIRTLMDSFPVPRAPKATIRQRPAQQRKDPTFML